MRYPKLYENYDDINWICREYNIKNYTINQDKSIDVAGVVDLSNLSLIKLPLKINKISGSLQIHGNKLISLKGCPDSIETNFDCSYNQLTSLKYFPKHIGGRLIGIDHNQLKSLEFLPLDYKNDLFCSYNKLTNLKGCPPKLQSLYCNYNKLISLEGCSEYISDVFNCSDNKIKTLVGGPKQSNAYAAENNLIYDLSGFPSKVNYTYLSGNPIYNIVCLVPDGLRIKFINLLIEYNVIQGDKIFEDGFDQAYYMVTKEEFGPDKDFEGYILR